MMGRAGQFGLLLWKNYLLQRRKIIVTCLEIGLPTLFAIILILVRQRVNYTKVTNETAWPEFPVNYYMPFPPPPFHWMTNGPWNIYFTPDTAVTNSLMSDVKEQLRRYGGNINDVIGFNNESSLQTDFLDKLEKESSNRSFHGKVLAAVVFTKLPPTNLNREKHFTSHTESLSWSDPVVSDQVQTSRVKPSRVQASNREMEDGDFSVKYKLRFPSILRSASTKLYVNPFKMTNHWFTRFMFPLFQKIGPRDNKTQGGQPSYLEEGFLALQYSVDAAVINLASRRAYVAVPIIDMKLRRFPYPPYINDNFVLVIQQQLPFIVLLSFVFSSMQIIKELVYEKERRLKESMKLMGLSNWLHWLAWFIKSFLLILISVLIITVLFVVDTGANGPVINYSSPAVILLFLLTYSLATISFCFMLSTLFSRANSAAAAGGIIFFITYIPYLFIQPRYDSLTWSAKVGCCLLSNVAMSLGGQVIGMFEGTGAGIQFSNIGQGASVDDDFKLLNVFVMLLLDTALYGVVTWYIEAVWPGEYGIPRPLYFPFQRSYWCGTSQYKSSDAAAAGDDDDAILSLEAHVTDSPDTEQLLDEPGDSGFCAGSAATDPRSPHCSTTPCSEYFEADPHGLRPGISIQNLHKEFGAGSSKKIAVCGMKLNLYEGQITALLGHNGAGKTTTMSILTGFFPPSSGTAVVNGYDICRDIDNVRRSLGLCPQHNVLFDELTVEEHLVFFAKLKGCHGDTVNTEVSSMLHDLHLVDKRHALVKTLSGGMKRKLSVGIALVAGSKVVILDEPTSGMDPDARRQTWDLLQRHRGQRTIVLSTHFMDEADILADRIAIMANGVVQCCGTSLFLKHKYGAGYHLAIVKQPQCDVNAITRLVQSHVSGARCENDVSAELSFVLPHESKTRFSELFKQLDEHKDSLGVASYGASVTTMEEVFIRVGDQSEQCASKPATDSATTTTTTTTRVATPEPPSNELLGTEKNKSFVLAVQQFYGLVLKRIQHTSRSWLLTSSQLLVPIAFTIIAMVVLKTLPGPGDSPPLTLDLSKFSDATVPYGSGVNDSVAENFAQFYGSFIKDNFPAIRLSYVNNVSGFERDPNMEKFLVTEGERSLATYNNHYLIACDVKSFETENNLSMSVDQSSLKGTVYFNNQGYHMQAISLNIFSNAILQSVLGGSSNFTLQTVNHPMPRTVHDTINDQVTQDFEGFAIAINLIYGMSFLSASFVLFLVRERAVKSKHSQFVSGASLATFWSSTFAWDLLCFIVPCIGILISFAGFNVVPYVGDGRYWFIVLLLLFYAWSMLPFMYLLSYIFTVPSTALVWLTVFNIVSGLATLLAVDILNIPQLGNQDIARALEWVFLVVLPNYCLGQGLEDFYTNYQFRNICSQSFITDLCNTYFCHNQLISIPCCQDCCGDFCISYTDNSLSFESGGLGRHITFLAIQGLVYLLLLVSVDLRIFQRIFSCVLNTCSRPASLQYLVTDSDGDGEFHVPEDDDVAAERQRISTPFLRDLFASNALVICDLTKTYRDLETGDHLTAVDGISFAVRRGECFGLLGVNGAGKTTTFQMLTGDLFPSSGDAFIEGFSVRHNIQQVQNRVGYCPQFDALIDLLTGRETLFIYARLRGIQEGNINGAVSILVHDLLLTPYADQLVKSYSGGNKRKLSTATALIGDAPVVFLDEPSTGLDPVARRHLWNTLSRVRASGRTLVFTSHSMEECDALCSQIAIMVNGRLKCLGSPQHLKSKFGDGYTLIAKVSMPSAGHGDVVLPLCHHVETTFPGSVLKDIHRGLVHYHVPRSPAVTLAELFAEMEAVRDKFSVEDYSVSQTTLEQVFINFARAQRPPRDELSISFYTKLKSYVKTYCGCCCCNSCGKCCRRSIQNTL